MRCLLFFINKQILEEKLCVGTCLKCLTVATPLVNECSETDTNLCYDDYEE